MFVALFAVGFLAAGCRVDDGKGDDGGSDDDVASLSEGDPDNESPEENSGDPEAEMTEWTGCMRDEGVDLPDPTQDADGNWVIDGQGIYIGGGGGGDTEPEEGEEPPFNLEDMEAAEEICGLFPGAAEFQEENQEELEAEALEAAECMRDEGIEDFPDPDFSEVGPGGPEKNTAEKNDGGGEEVLGPFGEVDLGDPATASAWEVCRDLMGGPEEGPAGPDQGGPESGGADD